jgi:hypothetical protein
MSGPAARGICEVQPLGQLRLLADLVERAAFLCIWSAIFVLLVGLRAGGMKGEAWSSLCAIDRAGGPERIEVKCSCDRKCLAGPLSALPFWCRGVGDCRNLGVVVGLLHWPCAVLCASITRRTMIKLFS